MEIDRTHKEALDRLNHLLKLNKISPAQVGRHLGVARQMVYRWLAGQQKMPRERIEQCADLFQMHPAELVYGVSVDKVRLKNIIEIVYEEADKQKVTLTPGRVAEIVVRCYGANGNSVKDLIALIAA